jgi:hypothetical protein
VKLKTRVVVSDKRIYFLVEDPAAGVRNVYTVYEIRLFGAKASSIVGRELPLQVALRMIRQRTEAA